MRRKPSLGRRILELTQPKGSVWSTRGKSGEVYRSVVGRALEQGSDTGIMTVLFFLHNFRKEMQGVFLECLHEQCPKAILIAADYTLYGLSPEQARSLLDCDFEREVLQSQGMERFLHHHGQFSLQDLQGLVEGAGWQHVSAAPLRAGRGVVVAAPCDIWKESRLTLQDILSEQKDN
jgi:hypothetical protein